jgi:hypothetical protein
MLLLAFVFQEKSHTLLNYLLVFFAWNMAVVIHELGHSLYVTHLCLFKRNLNSQSLSKINLIDRKEPYSYYRTIAAYKAFQQEYDEAKAALDQAKVFFHKGVKLYGYSYVEKHLLDQIKKEIMLKKAY